MNILMKLAPHAAILIGNMYYVFWGIDRVNKSMNFIDNGYTKFLILLLIAFSGLIDWRLARISLAKLRRTDNPVPVYVRLGVLALNALLGAAILVLLAIDLFNEDLLLFLNEFVKVLMLILSITSLLSSIQLTARERAVIRMQNRRRAQQRRPMPQPRPAPQPRYGESREPRYAPQQASRYADRRYPQPTARRDAYAQPYRTANTRQRPR